MSLWIIIIFSILMFLSAFIPLIIFICNAKKENAKIVSDGLTNYCIFIISLIIIGYEIDLLINISKISFSQSGMYVIILSSLSLAFNMLIEQNIFAYTKELLLVSYKKYNLSQLHIESIKSVVFHRISVKIESTNTKHVVNLILLRLIPNNYKENEPLFDRISNRVIQ